ncbi:OLC1v1010716C1 [Oldenlandia corymbosa var. corymbosa]|uniref:non-specific serine/threonine protein kinase n=1 Tax=Oldenlandia corymbosa var. corymbosa TaxID=529605 RepID=A0AAV1DVD8_OLDCO|nr:OLC1v1010716C1 [Oldenlandia corymbosa var. corymbosa]
MPLTRRLHSFTVNSFEILLLFLVFFTPSCCNGDATYSGCDRTYSCGAISNVTFPFTGGDRPDHCGLPEFKLTCQPNTNITELTHNSITYRVLHLDQTSKRLTLSRSDLYNNTCPSQFVNTTLNPTFFVYGDQDDLPLTLIYGCNSTAVTFTPGNLFDCAIPTSTFSDSYYIIGAIPSDPVFRFIPCSVSVTLPLMRSAGLRLTSNQTNLGEALMEGFVVNYTDPHEASCSECTGLGRQCGYDPDSSEFVCICGDRLCPLPALPPQYSRNTSVILPVDKKSGLSSQGSIGLAIGGAVLAGIGVGWIIFWCRQRRKRLAAGDSASRELPTDSKDVSAVTDSKSLLTKSVPSVAFAQSIPSYPSSKTEFGRDTTSYFGVQVFTYSELEEATDNFARSRELGDGGFGAVYYGVLKDGRIVAVKRLYENNFKRVEQFINEVEILTRLRHQNLVQLFGCTSKRSTELLLVYEYIPNGTVADHLHGKRSKSGLLSWPVRLNIAIETAEALAYLHESDIIHRDVKTNNILLDNDFHVKVADFGLSRLFPNDVTHVSTAPQGTPGYVDPEYYQCYQLTEKSDVYSFGVVLIEIISSLQAVDTNRHRLDINLANMAVNKIQSHQLHELVDPSLEFETNSSVRRMTTLVAELAFRCLQHERDMRPSMKEVLNALKTIQNEGLNAQKAEVLDILIDDGGHSEDKTSTASPTSVVPDTWVSSSGPNSSG